MDNVQEIEEAMGDENWRRSESVVRQAKAWVASGQRIEAIAALWVYAKGFADKKYEWRSRGRRMDGGLGPLELLRDLSSDEGDKQAMTDLIRRTQEEEERLRAEALEEVRAEEGDRPRKARKKKKRGKRKKSSARTAGAAMAGLQVGESAGGGGGDGCVDVPLQGQSADGRPGQQKPQEEEEQQLCSICLGELDADDGDVDVGDQADVLVCRHVYHASCLDRWACKCAEKDVEPTCPECRGPLLRVT